MKAASRLYVVPLALTLVDQASKWVILGLSFDPPRTINLLPFLNLTPVWNKGISFGLLGNAGAWAPVMLTVFALGVALVLPYMSRYWGRVGHFGGVLMSGGAFGNAIDRIIHGKVVDFIDVFAGQWHWPAFNVADMAIVIGAGIILLGAFNDARSQSKSEN